LSNIAIKLQNQIATPFIGIIRLDIKKITYILIVSLIASFFVRITGTLFPVIFQNLYIVKLAIVINTFFIIVHLLFFICFLRSYATNREQSLKIVSFLSIIGSIAVAFIYVKNFCLVFKLDIFPLFLMNYTFDAIIPLASSLIHLLFFYTFKKVQTQAEYKMLDRPIVSAIIGIGIFIVLDLIVLVNYLKSHKFAWLEHMHRMVAVGTLPFIALAAVLILYFYYKFYQFVSFKRVNT
jgi:hypothetical protein